MRTCGSVLLQTVRGFARCWREAFVGCRQQDQIVLAGLPLTVETRNS
jgi:hypothetical protein